MEDGTVQVNCQDGVKDGCTLTKAGAVSRSPGWARLCKLQPVCLDQPTEGLGKDSSSGAQSLFPPSDIWALPISSVVRWDWFLFWEATTAMLRCYSSSVLLVVFRDHVVCTLHELSDLPPIP